MPQTVKNIVTATAEKLGVTPQVLFNMAAEANDVDQTSADLYYGEYVRRLDIPKFVEDFCLTKYRRKEVTNVLTVRSPKNPKQRS